MKAWVDMTDEEKKKSDLETYLVEILLDLKCELPHLENQIEDIQKFIEKR